MRIRLGLLTLGLLLASCDIPNGAIDPYVPVAGIYSYNASVAGRPMDGFEGRLELRRLNDAATGRPRIGEFAGAWSIYPIIGGVKLPTRSGQVSDGRMAGADGVRFTLDGRTHVGSIGPGGVIIGRWQRDDTTGGLFRADLD
jgi:hypothetical protein